jgi:hypothetical protein
MENKVTNSHPEYDNLQPLRKIFEDVCAGTEKVRTNAYLPKFPAERDDDHKYRKDTATLLNVTNKTLQTLCGLVFQKDITLNEDVPTQIAGTEEAKGLIENIDNKGNHFNVFCRDAFEDSFDGCAGILVDSPTSKASDLAQQQSLGIRPYWVKYEACCITNWAFDVNPISKRTELALVVLKECVTENQAQFVRVEKTQYRVLMLDAARKPVWELWTEKPNQDSKKAKEYELLPGNKGSFGNQVSIPFAFIGDPCDRPPLMDLAFKNIEHLQTYSDYKSIIHKTCVPMLWTAGLDGKGPESIGGSSWWKLTENGTMGFAEVTGGSIEKTRQCLEDVKGEMALLGLAMLAANRRHGADVTATEKMLDSIQETSTLQVRATQLKDAIESALGFTALYMNLGEGGSIELGATWTEMVLSSDEITALSNLVDLGQMSKLSLLYILEKTGKLRPDVDAQEEMDQIDEELKKEAAIQPVIDATKLPNQKQDVPNGNGQGSGVKAGAQGQP